MGVQEFDPESPFGIQLKQRIEARLATLNVEDPAYVADYLLIMIKNGQSPSYIVDEFTNVVGPIIDQQFVQDVINEILMNQGQLNPSMAQPVQQQPQPFQQQEPAQLEPVQPQPATQLQPFSFTLSPENTEKQEFTFKVPDNNTQEMQFSFNIPTQPASMGMPGNDDMMIDGSDNKEVRFSEQNPFNNTNNVSAFGNNHQDNNSNRFNFNKNNRMGNNFKSSRGGRGGRGGARVANSRKQDNMSRMIEMSLDNNNDMTTSFVSEGPKQRCKDFPHCANKICPNIHPTKVCRAFPNCPNQNQTCTYLHPGEDDALYQEYERVRNAKREVKFSHQTGNTGIVLCKFGSVCQKEACPFAHPTPANRDAKVTLLQWCVDNKDCKNPNCTRAHSSPNFAPSAPVSSSPFGKSFNNSNSAHGGVNPEEKTLEQCKFGSYCKNPRCPKRHATSSVLCRDGANCTRIDCSFNHPKNEVCKFGVNCTNPKCAFQHPDGRQISANGATPTGNKVWINGQNQNTGSTSQRQFAVSEDQVLEQAPPQEA